MRAAVCCIYRLQRSRIDHPVFFQYLRLMDMSKRNIIISLGQKGGFMNRNMIFISAVGQKDLVFLPPAGTLLLVPGFPYLSGMIAQTVYRQVELRKFRTLKLLFLQHRNVAAPVKSAVVGILTDIVMVPGDQHHLCLFQRGEHPAHLFELSKERLPVEQIPGHQ